MKPSRREIIAGIGAAAAHGIIAPGLPAEAATGFPRREDFAIPAGTAYLNAAMIHPMPHVAADAITRGMQLRVSGATVPSFAGGGAKPLPKASFAALINARPSEIAFVPNTSTGENLVVKQSRRSLAWARSRNRPQRSVPVRERPQVQEMLWRQRPVNPRCP